MFGKDQAPRPTPLGTRSGQFSLIGSDVTITGDIAAGTDLHIDGAVTGDVTCAALVIGKGGRVAGKVIADTARIAGAVEGSVRAATLVIEAGAQISGDVEYGTITIETGGHVDGRLSRADGEPVKLIASSVEAA